MLALLIFQIYEKKGYISFAPVYAAFPLVLSLAPNLYEYFSISAKFFFLLQNCCYLYLVAWFLLFDDP